MKFSPKEALANISLLTPKLIFLTGKSGTGKSYYSNILANKYNYKILELDKIIRNIAKKHNIGYAPNYAKAFSIYKGDQSEVIMKDFINEIHTFIDKHPNNPILIEGAISNAQLINNIFSKQYSVFAFIYLNPSNIKKYANQMMKRFKEDKRNKTKTLSIWPEVTTEINNLPTNSPKVAQFIMKQAKQSKKKSDERLQYFVSNKFKVYIINI